jgi:cytochrome P450
MREFPSGAAVTVEQLEGDPHPVLAQLREREPVSWLPALGGWMVTRHELALEVMRDPDTFTVDDPRFSTAQIIGPSMLSLDGAAHQRHRELFVAPFRPQPVRERFTDAVRDEAERLLETLLSRGEADLRTEFAGPLAAATVTRALGLPHEDVDAVLESYRAIVGGVTEITAGTGTGESGGEAFAQLRARLRSVLDEPLIADAAVLLFGGIETTEGMIANALLLLLEHGQADPLEGALEESLRLEPSAAVIDRYATRDIELGGGTICRGDLVRVSIAAANRDPAVFDDPDRFDPHRPNGRRHLAFAQGPHVCLGIHLARLEGAIALATALERLPNLRLDPERPSRIRGLVFRKPPTLHVVWG